MEEYLKKILNNDLTITHGVYEPPNNIPILRYMVNKKGYKIILLGSDLMKLSCEKWLSTEGIIPTYNFENIDEIYTIDKNNNYFVIIADQDYKYSSYQSKLLKVLSDNGIKNFLCPYDYEKIPKHDINYLNYFLENENNLIKMLNLLYDEESKQTYVEYIRSKAFCDFYRLKQHPTWQKYFDESIYKHMSDECFINCGCSNGDTIFYFLEKFDNFSKIYALDSDSNRIKQFKENLGYLPSETIKKIINISTNVDNNDNKLDFICKNEPITLINMDIEGMELDALKGAREIILNNKPVIAACAYHLPTDLYELPMFLKSLDDDYKIFYRKYASTVRNRFCNAELVMYAVPEKRLTK